MVGDPMLAPEIASSALVHAFCTVDAGMTYRQTTTVGERTFLQARVHLGHNAVIGDDCEICAGVVVCGEVMIGDGVRVGGNSWVKPLVTIGDGAIIGGGSVVTKDVPAHEVWCGNPARLLKLADTHPMLRGLRGRQKVAPQYGMSDDEWQAARDVVQARYVECEEVWAMQQPWHHRGGAA
jgi:acyl-[acyl carrier protein]--UDP-N-acetylglucosamine O-acyltransferase